MRRNLSSINLFTQFAETMNKIKKLKISNWTLLIIYILTLVSSLQLEIAGNASRLWVILHLIVATSFLAVIIWHIYLHFRWDNWRRLLKGKKKGILKWMSIFCLLVILSAVIATIDWYIKGVHTGPGAIHGKIGFIFLIAVVIHLIKHSGFYRK